MSRDHRSGYYNRDRDRDWNREYHRPVKRSRSRSRSNLDKRRSRTPRKSEKDILDENILSEISKLPEPSELWDTQFQDNNFSAPPPPSFQSEPVPNTAYNSNYSTQYTGIYDDFNSVPSAPPPPDMGAWNQMSLPPPPQPPPAPVLNSEDQIKKEAAIESEMRQQKAALSKQREDYIKKAGILKKELDTLKDQRNELRGDAKRSPSPDTKRFLKENTKLQLEIQNKLKTITNVVDMLNGIIGEEAQVVIPDSDSSTERSKRKSRSPTGNKFNYVYYDPEMHWCRVCNEFPPTAKDYLNHLHSPAHHKMAAAHMEAPWHSVSGINEGFPNYPSAPNKRTPIRGLQFFVPSTAWYCKLCDQFIGDLHCASAHLKSILHSKNYTNFVEQNPHWETDWMSDRQKAVEKSRASKKSEHPEEKQAYTSHTITFHKDGFHTKHKESPPRTPEEKKKRKEKKRKSKRKRSSSASSSSSSSSDSEPKKKKKKNRGKKEKHGQQTPDDKTLTEWVSNIELDRLNDNDRKLLDSLKNRIKKDKQEEEKRRSPSRASRERERERSIADLQRRLRETERRDIRPHDERRRDERRDDRRDERRDERREDRRDERRDDRRDERREERRDERREERPPVDVKKQDVKKMPFIGKMPVFKNMVKTPKTDEQKKDDQKKKQDEEVSQKRRQEMDVEIQKKVAEFKQKIAKAQLERQQQLELQAHTLVLPPQQFLPPLGSAPTLAIPPPTLPTLSIPPPTSMPTATPQQPQPNLSKDFQDALDIIFPTGEVKNPELPGQEMFAMPPGFPLMPPFQPLGLMQPQMFGFDMNGQLFPPRPQLYDAHVPLVSSPKPRMQNKNNRQKQNDKEVKKNPPNATKEVVKNKEELDDLAMLGIDATDVGAGI